MPSYAQFCPVAKAMEILDERWTMLVLRELVSGSTQFNEIRRGVPRMSPALLSKRLRSLVRAGLVERRGEGQQVTYTLTPAGEELGEVIRAVGVWGLRWVPELGEEDYDPHLLLWDMRRTVAARVPDGERRVLELCFDDVEPRLRHWWLVVRDADVDVCDADPGFEVSTRIDTGLRTLVRIWRGERSWTDALRDGEVRMSASATEQRAVVRLLGRSDLAERAAALG